MWGNAVLLASRLLMALLFMPSGISTLRDIEGSAAYFAGLGLPLPMAAAWGVGLFELIAGILILFGGQTRVAALLLALFCLAAGYVGHHGQGGGDPAMAFMHAQALMKDIAIAGGFLALSVAGPGRWSLDGLRM